MTASSPPRAFIFDLDGVITDTAHLHFRAWRDLGALVGLANLALFAAAAWVFGRGQRAAEIPE